MDQIDSEILQIIGDFASALEAAAVQVKHRIAELTSLKEAVAVKEETFNILKFEKRQGARIGEYELAYKANNITDKWVHAFNILRQNNSIINSRYEGQGYFYRYWIYGEGKIYRQKLKVYS